jgi:hypothetical protein
MPIPEMIRSTTSSFSVGVALTADMSRMSPVRMWRFVEMVNSDMPWKRRSEVSFEGVRARAVQVYPSLRARTRAASQ